MNIKNILASEQKTIVDVREPWEFAEGHFPDAINIPLGDIMANPNQLTEAQLPIVAYCRSGNRSQSAMMFLKANGISEVYNGGSLHQLQSMLELS